MQNITYEQACELFTDSICVSVPMKYHSIDTIDEMQLYLGLLATERGEDLINAVLNVSSNKMHIVSPSEHYVVEHVNDTEFSAFQITHSYLTNQ